MTLYKLKLYIKLYWSTFLSYFKKKPKNNDVYIYENDIEEHPYHRELREKNNDKRRDI